MYRGDPALRAAGRIWRRWVALLLLVLAPAMAQALDVPRPRGYVTDLAGVLPGEFVDSLELALAAYERDTSNQIAVLVVPTLAGDNLESFSLRVAEKWRLGQAGRDNGVLLLVAMAERKIRIEVGYGLEGAIPDSLAGQIIRREMAPKFRQGDFAGGIEAAVSALQQAAAGAYQAAAPDPWRGDRPPWYFAAGFFAIFMIAGGGVLGHALTYLRHRKVPVLLFAWSVFFLSIPLAMAYFVFGRAMALVQAGVLAIAAAVAFFKAPYRGHVLERSAGGGWRIVSGGSRGYGGGASSSSGGFSGGGGSFGGGGASGGW